MNKKLIAVVAVLGMALSGAAAAQAYLEDFEDGLAQGWEPGVPQEWTVLQRANGNRVYRAYAAAPAGDSYVSLLGDRSFTDFDYRATLRDNHDLASYIVFRVQPGFTGLPDSASTGYGFGIDALCPQEAGAFYLVKWVDGITVSAPGDWIPSPYIRCDGSGNRLRVVAQGAELRFYVNGKAVFRYVDPAPIVSGQVGLLGYGAYGTTDGGHEFDRITVTPLPAN
jgi:hypothetical protein